MRQVGAAEERKQALAEENTGNGSLAWIFDDDCGARASTMQEHGIKVNAIGSKNMTHDAMEHARLSNERHNQPYLIVLPATPTQKPSRQHR